MNISKLKTIQRRRLIIFLKNNTASSIVVALISLLFFTTIFYLIFVYRNLISLLLAFIIFIIYRFVFLILYSLYNRWALQTIRKYKKRPVYKKLKYNISDILSITLSALISELIGYIFFIIPGIIITQNFIMKYYVYYDYHKYGKAFVLKESHRVLSGYRKELCSLILSFLPYYILSILTFGIGFVYFLPYFSLCTAAFYEKIRIKKLF